jgi:type I restriction enzyme R subunit
VSGREIVPPGTPSPQGLEKFRAKARQFLCEHNDHVTIQKLRRNRPLTLRAHFVRQYK